MTSQEASLKLEQSVSAADEDLQEELEELSKAGQMACQDQQS